MNNNLRNKYGLIDFSEYIRTTIKSCIGKQKCQSPKVWPPGNEKSWLSIFSRCER